MRLTSYSQLCGLFSEHLPDRKVTAYNMTATNHDGHKVYQYGHSSENVKKQRRTFKKSLNSRRIHGRIVFRR